MYYLFETVLNVLLVQLFSLHASLTIGLPAQVLPFPLGRGLLQNLTLTRVPPPQVRVQPVTKSGLTSLQPPFTAELGGKCILNKRVS